MDTKETDTKCELCFRCLDFKRFYTKEPSKFAQTKHGYCRKHEKFVKSTEHCDQWRSDSRRLCARKKISLRILADLLENISAIKQVLQEAQDGERE